MDKKQINVKNKIIFKVLEGIKNDNLINYTRFYICY